MGIEWLIRVDGPEVGGCWLRQFGGSEGIWMALECSIVPDEWSF